MVIIRKAQPSDLDSLDRIFNLNIPKYFHEKELVDFKKYFNSNNIETYFIIESEGKILGSKLKMIEDTWVHNNFQISDKQIQKIIKA